MVDLYMRRHGCDLRPCSKETFARVAELPEGVTLRCQVSKPRSNPAHRMFFGIIAVAFEQWPENAKFKPTSVEHLRSWALIKAGHYNSLDVPAHNPKVAAAIVIKLVEAVKADDKHPIIWAMKDSVRVYTPKSVAYSEVAQADFSKISEAVYTEIEKVLGVPIAELRRQVDRQDLESDPVGQAVLKSFPDADVV